MMPYEPLDAQLIALQFRLFRAARALLDPMLNLGLINRNQAGTVLTRDAVLSKAMVHQELDRSPSTCLVRQPATSTVMRTSWSCG